MSSGVGGRTFWPIGEAPQADYEMLRAYMLSEGDLPLSLPAVRFSRRGLAGLARHRVSVAFTDAPAMDENDPQSKLLTQVQGVIAEYERAKIAERYRRGKLFRSRAGEVLAWRTPYGYLRLPRDAAGPGRLGRVDRHHGPGHCHRRGVRRRRTSQPRQQQVEPAPSRTRPMAPEETGPLRSLRRSHQLP